MNAIGPGSTGGLQDPMGPLGNLMGFLQPQGKPDPMKQNPPPFTPWALQMQQSWGLLQPKPGAPPVSPFGALLAEMQKRQMSGLPGPGSDPSTLQTMLGHLANQSPR